jgi:hypothetical protein
LVVRRKRKARETGEGEIGEKLKESGKERGK